MIFAEMEYESKYSEIHSELVSFLSAHFSGVKSGHQSDSWIHISDGENLVKVDSFSSMKHEVKSDQHSPLVTQVIDCLSTKYQVHVYSEPELEPDEEY